MCFSVLGGFPCDRLCSRPWDIVVRENWVKIPAFMYLKPNAESGKIRC